MEHANRHTGGRDGSPRHRAGPEGRPSASTRDNSEGIDESDRSPIRRRKTEFPSTDNGDAPHIRAYPRLVRELQEREKEYQQSLRHSPLMLARTDASLRYEWILNPHPDFDTSQIVGKRDDELASGPGIDALIDLKRRVLEQGVQERREITFTLPSGPRTYDVTATPFRDRLGHVTHVLTAAVDITERKQAEEELRKSEERYRTLFDSIEEGFCVLEILFDDAGRPADYRFLETNPAFERHTGLVNAVGRTARELVPGLERHWVDLYARVAETGEPAHFVEESPSMGRWFEVQAFRVGRPERHRVGLLFTDITERKQAEQALRDLNDTLEERVEQRTRQVQELTYRLTMAEQAERNRISQVLHDNLQQQLYGIQMKMGFARRALEDGDLDRLTSATRRPGSGKASTLPAISRSTSVRLSCTTKGLSPPSSGSRAECASCTGWRSPSGPTTTCTQPTRTRGCCCSRSYANSSSTSPNTPARSGPTSRFAASTTASRSSSRTTAKGSTPRPSRKKDSACSACGSGYTSSAAGCSLPRTPARARG